MSPRAALAVWRRNYAVFRRNLWASVVGAIGEPVLTLLIMGYGLGTLVPQVNGVRYIEYLAPGLVVVSAMYAAAFELTFGAYTRMVVARSWSAALATPVMIGDLVMGELFWGATKALFTSAAMLVAMAFVGLAPLGPEALAILALGAFTGFIFGAAALAFSAVTPGYEFFNYFFVLFLTPVYFLSGVFFPVEALPQPLEALAYATPATWAVSLTREMFGQAGMMPPALALGLMTALAAALAWLATALSRRRIVV